MDLVSISRRLSRATSRLVFEPPVTHVYNPLQYAREPHETYLTRYGSRGSDVLLLGMNPGPFGMAQTGVPFGAVGVVRDWLGLGGKVGRPKQEHPKRPIEGLACTRNEVSGERLWGWARERFGTPARFFERFFVWNYCPLLFMEESGRNRTPDKLPASERDPLFAACNRALAEVVAVLEPRLVVGVGKFAEGRARAVLQGDGPGRAARAPKIGTILHPSPASPIANRGWAPQAEAQLAAMGVDVASRSGRS